MIPYGRGWMILMSTRFLVPRRPTGQVEERGSFGVVVRVFVIDPVEPGRTAGRLDHSSRQGELDSTDPVVVIARSLPGGAGFPLIGGLLETVEQVESSC